MCRIGLRQLRPAQTRAFQRYVRRPTSKHPDAAAAGQEAFATLLGFVKSCQDQGGLVSANLHQMALLAWTMVHGIVKLAITGRLPFHSTETVLKFSEFVIDQSLPVSWKK
jgi:hypothetical protein